MNISEFPYDIPFIGGPHCGRKLSFTWGDSLPTKIVIEVSLGEESWDAEYRLGEILSDDGAGNFDVDPAFLHSTLRGRGVIVNRGDL